MKYPRPLLPHEWSTGHRAPFRRVSVPSTLKTTGVSANLLIISKPKFHLPVSADRRVKQRDDYRVAWVTLLPTCPQLGREHPHQLSYTARLRILASLPLRIKTGDYPLAESKGNVGYKSKQKGNRPINKIHANRKVARVACSLRIGGGCAELETLGFVSSCAFFFSQIPLSLCQDNSRIFCSWADTGNQILSVSITILPREITHLELNYYHKLLRISDCYRCR